jgi:hypothetical protein
LVFFWDGHCWDEVRFILWNSNGVELVLTWVFLCL